MKVTLAYAREIDGKAHKADATVDVDDETGRALIRDGHARPADTNTTTDKKGV